MEPTLLTCDAFRWVKLQHLVYEIYSFFIDVRVLLRKGLTHISRELPHIPAAIVAQKPKVCLTWRTNELHEHVLHHDK